jgi:hypothetical protein
MAEVKIPWADMSASPMVVFRSFRFFGVDYRPGQPFRCDDPEKMRKLYEQRMIRPDPEAIAEGLRAANERAAEKAELPRDESGRFQKRG